jgi:hypothetical protein
MNAGTHDPELLALSPLAVTPFLFWDIQRSEPVRFYLTGICGVSHTLLTDKTRLTKRPVVSCSSDQYTNGSAAQCSE